MPPESDASKPSSGKQGGFFAKVGSNKKLVYGGIVVTVLGGYYLYKKHKNATAASTGIDPTTGYPTGSAADLAALQALNEYGITGSGAPMNNSGSSTPQLFGGGGSGTGGGGGGGGGTSRTRTTTPAPASVPPSTPATPVGAAPVPAPIPAPAPMPAPAPAPAIIPAPAPAPAPVAVVSPTTTSSPTPGTLVGGGGVPFNYVRIYTPSSGAYSGQGLYALGNQDEVAAAKAAGFTVVGGKAIPGANSAASYAIPK